MLLNNEQVKRIKEKYPIGTRIKLNHMDDPYAPIPSGSEGIVTHVDDQGQLSMSWDNGRSLSIIPGEDSFSIISKPETLRVLLVEPGKHPRVDVIDKSLKGMQNVVGGYIEEIYLDDDSVLICNEEGKLNNLPANRRFGNDVLAGTFFIARDDGGEELMSLTDEQIDKYQNKFYEIEEISQSEMMDAMTMKFYGGM